MNMIFQLHALRIMKARLLGTNENQETEQLGGEGCCRAVSAERSEG